MEDLNWEQIRSYLAVMEHRSLSGAARHLGMTQPTVGRHIDGLESSLGVPLFVRSHQGLTPTTTALDLLPQVQTMAKAAASLRRIASGDHEEPRGTVRLSASEIVATEFLPAMLALFVDIHPKIDLELVATNAANDLLKREADIAVRMFPPKQPALVAKKVGDTPVRLYAHASYVEVFGVPTCFAELGKHRLIGHDLNRAILQTMRENGVSVERSQFHLRTDSEPTQHALIRAGAGIGGMQTALAQRDPCLVPVLPELVCIPMQMWLVMHEELRSTRRVRLLFDFLARELKAAIGA